MRILILCNIGLGLFKFRRELLEELVKSNEVICCFPEDDYVESIEKIGCSFVACNSLERHGTNPFKELSVIQSYKRIIKHVQPNIVFTFTIKPNVYGGIVCSSLGVPYVANITGLGTAVEKKGIMQLISLSLYKMGLRKAQKVFFQNTDNRDFMISKNIVHAQYDLLPGSGVNLNQYKPLPYPDGETIDFIFVARVMKEKGIDQYIDAATSIRKRFIKTRFHVFGFCDDNYKERLIQLQNEGIIIFHGLVKEMEPFYKMAACIIHPSYYPEGISNVLLESAASGRPIITTDRPGCREVVNDGVNGYLVRPKDSNDLIDKIERFLGLDLEDRCEMGLKGRSLVEQFFDRSIVVNKYMEETKKVVIE